MKAISIQKVTMGCLLVICSGCVSVKKLEITSEPPGADIFRSECPPLADIGGQTPSGDLKDTGNRTPFTYRHTYVMGMPVSYWGFQVKKTGFLDSVFRHEALARQESTDSSNYKFHFVLKPIEQSVTPLPSSATINNAKHLTKEDEGTAVIQRLQELGRLKAAGTITEKEYTEQRERVLNSL
jgi:hypothetical protein